MDDDSDVLIEIFGDNSELPEVENLLEMTLIRSIMMDNPKEEEMIKEERCLICETVQGGKIHNHYLKIVRMILLLYHNIREDSMKHNRQRTFKHRGQEWINKRPSPSCSSQWSTAPSDQNHQG